MKLLKREQGRNVVKIMPPTIRVFSDATDRDAFAAFSDQCCILISDGLTYKYDGATWAANDNIELPETFIGDMESSVAAAAMPEGHSYVHEESATEEPASYVRTKDIGLRTGKGTNAEMWASTTFEKWMTLGETDPTQDYKTYVKDANGNWIPDYDVPDLSGKHDQIPQTKDVINFADAIGGDHTGFDIVRTQYHHDLQYCGGANYRRTGDIGTANSGDEGVFFDSTGSEFSMVVPHSGVDVRSFGLEIDTLVNSSPIILSAIKFAKGRKVSGFESGEVKIATSIEYNGDVHLHSNEGTVFNTDGGVFVDGIAFNFHGEQALLPSLASPVAKMSNTIEFTSSHGLSAGDMISVYDPLDYSWSGFRPYYRAGEFAEVLSVSGNNVTTRVSLFDSYGVGVEIYKVEPIKVSIDGLSIVGSGATHPLSLDFSRDSCVRNSEIRVSGYEALAISRSLRVLAEDVCVDNSGISSDDYGIGVYNSQDVTISRCVAYGRRHGVAVGGGSVSSGVVNRGVKCIDSKISNDNSTLLSSADMHGNVENCGYYKCDIYNGSQACVGSDTYLIECNIVGGLADSIVISANETKGGVFTIKGNTCISKDSSGSPRGVVVDVSQSTALTVNTTIDVEIHIVDNRFECSELNSSAEIISIFNRGSTKKVSVNCSGNDFIINDALAHLSLRNLSGTADSDFIIFEGNKTTVLGKYGVYNDGVYSEIPVLWHQGNQGVVDVNLLSGLSDVASEWKAHSYRFPRKPSFLVGGISPVKGIAYIDESNYPEVGTAIRVSTSDGSNFPASETVSVSYRSEIREV